MSYIPLLQTVLNYIDKHISDSLTPEHLARSLPPRTPHHPYHQRTR